MSVEINFHNESAEFFPGEQFSGEVNWDFPLHPGSITIRLYWYTTGKGDRNGEVIDSSIVESRDKNGKIEFSFTLPRGPYSFAGRLVKFNWAVEAIPMRGERCARELKVVPRGSMEVS